MYKNLNEYFNLYVSKLKDSMMYVDRIQKEFVSWENMLKMKPDPLPSCEVIEESVKYSVNYLDRMIHDTDVKIRQVGGSLTSYEERQIVCYHATVAISSLVAATEFAKTGALHIYRVLDKFTSPSWTSQSKEDDKVSIVDYVSSDDVETLENELSAMVGIANKMYHTVLAMMEYKEIIPQKTVYGKVYRGRQR